MFFRTFTLVAGLVGSLGTAHVQASCGATGLPSVSCVSSDKVSTLSGTPTSVALSSSIITASSLATTIASTSVSTLSGTPTSVALSSSIITTSSLATTIASTSVSSSVNTTGSLTTTTSASISSSTVVVNPDGSAQFTAINSAILYAQQKAIPTVYVKAGTYEEALTVSGSAAVTVIGETNASNDYSQNKVTVSVPGIAMTVNTDAVKNTVWKNINFVTTSTASPAYAVSLRGTKNAFYNCQIISAGSHAVYSTLGITLIANSYVEATTKAFAGYLGMYIFGSTIAATDASNGVLLYNQGYNSINSQVVFDSCTLTQKSGATNKNVYLALPNGNNAQGIFKNTYMSDMIIPQGVYSYSSSYTSDFYGEFNSSGPGSYAQNSASRASLDNLMTVSQLSSWTIESVFANSWPAFATTDLSWIDSSVLAAIKAVSAANTAASSISTSVVSTTSSSSLTSSPSSTGSSNSSTALLVSSSSSSVLSSATSLSSDNSTLSHAVTSTTDIPSSSINSSVVATTTCVSYALPSSVPSTAKVVGTVGSCANYTSVSAAVNDLPADSTTQYVYILAGSYEGQVSLARKGATIFRGESESPLDQSQNLVTITRSNGALSSSGNAESTSTFITTQYNSKNLAFYNINFVNTYTQASNYVAAAMDIKAQQVGFYSCGFQSTGGTFLANYGSFFLAGCRIEGGQDFFWGYGAAYVYNSVISSNTAGYSIAAQWYQSSYGNSQFVFDTCAVVPSSSTVGSASTYLGRDYTTSSRVAYINSFLDGHIKPIGWYIGTTGTSVTFAESNNTGPGAAKPSSSTSSGDSASRPAIVNLSPDVSAYSAASVLGDISWVDSDAIPVFSGFPSAVYPDITSSTISSISSIPTISTIAMNSTISTTSTIAAVSSTSATACPTATLVVNQNPENTCEYSTISAAVAALPNDGLAKTIIVQPGSYNEQVIINRSGKVTLIGSTTYPNDFTQNTVTVWYQYGVSTSAGQDELTPVLNSKKSDLAVHNINFHNTFDQTYNYAALAADFYGSNMAFYGCSFTGYQDTLLLNKGVQVLSNCYIEGSVDFIWGFSTAFLHGCYIASNTPGDSICAQSRSSATATGGYVIDSSLITYTSSYGSTMGKTYLGRPYSAFSRVVYTNSYLDSNINAAGWSVWSTNSPQTSGVTFGEYNNVGPSSSTANRASFSTQLSADAAQAYTLENWIGDTSWINMTAYNFAPSYSWTDSSATTVNATTSAIVSATASSTASSTSVTINDEASSTAPASGDYIVSKTAIDGKTTYSSLTDVMSAIASISSSKTVTVFVYPGVYQEQLLFSRSGTTVFRGYTESPHDNTQNQVIIQNSVGVDTQADQSNSDSATLYSRAKYLQMYNINLNNVFGSTDDYASLGFAIGNNGYASFFGCHITGNQDTFDLNSGTSVFAYNTLIEGSIDFIWGAGSGYFLKSTIVPNADGGCITADKRTSDTSAGGLVFDQCTVAAASGVSAGSIFLGRPYNQYARVAWINSYLDSSINSAGWSVWSKTNPQTSGVVFGEYHNYGPGASTSGRASFSEQLSDADVAQFQLANFFASQGTSWINMTYVDAEPFVAGSYTTNTYTSLSAPSTISALTTVYTTASTTLTVTIPGSTVTDTATSIQRTTEVLAASTVTTTKLTTEKTTGYTTISEGIVTKYTGVTTTVGSSATVTPDPVIKTKLSSITVVEGSTATISPDAVTVSKFKTVSTTVGSSVTITPDPVIVTISKTVRSTTGSSITVTPEPQTVYKYTTIISTVISASEVPGSTVTDKETQTILTTLTSTQPDKTVTTTSTDMATVTKTSTPKGATITSTVSTVTIPGTTKTSSLKATTSLVTMISTVTKTSKTTTTLSCTPLAKVKRDLDMGSINRFNYRAVAASGQAISTQYTTITVTATGKPATVTTTVLSPSTVEETAKALTTTEFLTITSTAKIITSTLDGGTTLLTTTNTQSIGGTVTLKAGTTTTTIVSTRISSITDVVTLKGVTTTDLETLTKTKTIGGTTTLKGSTTTTTDTVTEVSTIDGTTTLAAGKTTLTSTVTETQTSVAKKTAPAVTVHTTAVVTSKDTTTVPGTTNSVTVLKHATVSSTLTLPTQTVQVDKTATITGARVTITAAQQTVTKTTVRKSTTTTWSTVTKYAKSATTCAA